MLSNRKTKIFFSVLSIVLCFLVVYILFAQTSKARKKIDWTNFNETMEPYYYVNKAGFKILESEQLDLAQIHSSLSDFDKLIEDQHNLLRVAIALFSAYTVFCVLARKKLIYLPLFLVLFIILVFLFPLNFDLSIYKFEMITVVGILPAVLYTLLAVMIVLTTTFEIRSVYKEIKSQ